MANMGKPKSVKMAKVSAPQMKTPTAPKQNMGQRPSKAHPWDGSAGAAGKMPGGKC